MTAHDVVLSVPEGEGDLEHAALLFANYLRTKCGSAAPTGKVKAIRKMLVGDLSRALQVHDMVRAADLFLALQYFMSRYPGAADDFSCV